MKSIAKLLLILRILVALSPLILFFSEPPTKANTIKSVNHLLDQDSYTYAVYFIPLCMIAVYYFIGKNYEGTTEQFKQLLMSVCLAYLMYQLTLEIEYVLEVYSMDSNAIETVLRLVMLVINIDLNMFEMRHLYKVASPKQ